MDDRNSSVSSILALGPYYKLPYKRFEEKRILSERPCAYLHGCMCLQRAPSAEEAKYNIFYDIYPIHVYKFCERPCAYLVLTLCVLAAGTVRIHTYIHTYTLGWLIGGQLIGGCTNIVYTHFP